MGQAVHQRRACRVDALLGGGQKFGRKPSGETWMTRTPSLGTLMFAFLSLNVCWAQSKADEPAFPFTKTIFRWDYSCPTGTDCNFACPGIDTILANPSKLHLYLGTLSIDGGKTVPVIFYEYTARGFPHASGFSIGSDLSTLSCRTLGMTLDFSGPPK